MELLFYLENRMKHLILHVSHESALWFEENLSGYDITGLEIDNDRDPAYTDLGWHWDEALVPPPQENVRILVYGRESVLKVIEQDLMPQVISIDWAEQEDKNWMAKWMAEFTGFPVGERLYIQPVHDLPDPERINLVIQAGMAFGTGTHETTMGCLEALERYLKPHDRVIDIGSGSGILSIASIKLGASHVTAVEIDQTALANAEENRRLNRVEDHIDQRNSDLAKDLTESAELMVANILPEVLVRLTGDAGRLVKPDGILILSGIIIKRTQEMLEHYEPTFELIETITKGEWNTLVFRRR